MRGYTCTCTFVIALLRCRAYGFIHTWICIQIFEGVGSRTNIGIRTYAHSALHLTICHSLHVMPLSPFIIPILQRGYFSNRHCARKIFSLIWSPFISIYIQSTAFSRMKILWLRLRNQRCFGQIILTHSTWAYHFLRHWQFRSWLVWIKRHPWIKYGLNGPFFS